MNQQEPNLCLESKILTLIRYQGYILSLSGPAVVANPLLVRSSRLPAYFLSPKT